MEPGRRVFGRFEITGPLPDVGDLERHAAVEVETGREVELVRPGALAALRPGARERFRAAWNPEEAQHLPPSRLPALAVGELDGRPAAIRPRVAVAWSPTRRLTADRALELAGWLLPALTVSPPPGGVLTTEDVVVDATGRPWLAPTGIVPKPTVSNPPLHTPPNSADSEIDRARYGLGVLLFRAVSGEWPFEPTGDRARLSERQNTPTPLDQVAEVPDALANVVNSLVHPDAARRARAAVPPPIEPPSLPVQDKPHRPPSARIAVPEKAAPTLRRDAPVDDYAIVLHSHQATDAARRRLAALMDLPANAFVLPSGAPEEVLVATAKTEADAARRLAELTPAGAPLEVVSTATPTEATTAMSVGLAGLLLGAPAMGFALGPFGAALVAMLALVGMLFGWRAMTAAARRRDTLQRTGQYVERGPRAAPALADGAQQLGVGRRAQSARKAVLLADLPDTVRIDLLASIDELEAAGGQSPEAVQAGLDDIAHTAREWSEQGPSAEDALSRARRAVAAARGVHR